MKKYLVEWLLAGATLAAALGAAAFVISFLPRVVDKPPMLKCAAPPAPISFADASIDPRFFHPAKQAHPTLKPAKARK